MDEESSVPVRNEDIPTIVKTLLNNSPADLHGCGYGLKRGKCVLVHIAVDLCSDINIVRRIRKDLQSDKISPEEAFTKILEDWLRGHDGNRGSLEELMSALTFPSNELSKSTEMAKTLFVQLSLPRKKIIPTEVDNDKPINVTEKAEARHGDEDTEQNPTRERALANSVILEEIFKKLNIEERKNFRLVNRFWFQQSLLFWRNSSRIQIINEGEKEIDESTDDDNDTASESDYRYIADPYVEHEPGVKMKNFVELLEQETEMNQTEPNKILLKLQERPFRSYQFSTNVYLDSNQPNKKFEEYFWTACAPHIENLKLKNITLLEKEDFQLLPRLLLETCPNLKTSKGQNRALSKLISVNTKCFKEFGDSST